GSGAMRSLLLGHSPLHWRTLPPILGWIVCWLVVQTQGSFGQEKLLRLFQPEEKHIQVRDPSTLPRAAIPNVPPPPTVSDPRWGDSSFLLGLDDALQTALGNSVVVRILTGVTATSSGSTIYDSAISNTAIDEAKGRFDPVLDATNTFSRSEPPQPRIDPLD